MRLYCSYCMATAHATVIIRVCERYVAKRRSVPAKPTVVPCTHAEQTARKASTLTFLSRLMSWRWTASTWMEAMEPHVPRRSSDGSAGRRRGEFRLIIEG